MRTIEAVFNQVTEGAAKASYMEPIVESGQTPETKLPSRIRVHTLTSFGKTSR
jgi:hypothetical protein